MGSAVPERLVHEATEVLREAIVSGQLPPGGRLIQERLAQELGISRTPLREALLRLEQQGLVASAGRRGLAVASLSPEIILDTMDVRGNLDTLAAQWAVDRMTNRELAQLRAAHERARRCIVEWQPEAWLAANIEFHLHVVRGAHSPPLERAMPVGRMPVRLLVSNAYFEHGQAQIDFAEHQQIMESLEARDVERVRAAAEHHAAQRRQAMVEQLNRLEGATVGLRRLRRR